MKGWKNGPCAEREPLVYRLSAEAELVLSQADSLVLIVRGACDLRTGGKLARVTAGTVLLRQSDKKNLERPIARALELIHAEPAKRWTVERLARAVGLSRAAFARRFVTASGRSPLRYVTQLRLALAASWLESDDPSLAEIALRVGYASEFAFSRAFKRQYGIAPGGFRRLRAPFAPTRMAA
jgi:AraC-like DNA-binding protein